MVYITPKDVELLMIESLKLNVKLYAKRIRAPLGFSVAKNIDKSLLFLSQISRFVVAKSNFGLTLKLVMNSGRFRSRFSPLEEWKCAQNVLAAMNFNGTFAFSPFDLNGSLRPYFSKTNSFGAL